MGRIQFFFRIITFTALFLVLSDGYGQKLLNRKISISAKNKPVAEVLKLIESQSDFSFSYNSDIIPGDSLVTVSYQSQSVKHILDILLAGNYQYKETGGYIIIQRPDQEKYYQLTGQIFDNETGKAVDYASVYSQQKMVSDLTDDSGFFKLRIRDRTFPYTLTVSKIGYADTSIVINSGNISELKIGINSKAIDLDTLVVKYSEGGNFWLTNLFVSSRLRLQSRNISKFFVSLPYQISLTPGLSSHGRLSSQIINKVSINIYGGYTAGVDGVEIAGLFNINKKDARYLQMSTTFNAVSGKFTGVQLCGIYNQVLDSLQGVQVSGFAGWTNKYLYGVQLSGIFNKVSGNLRGVQISGGGNIAKREVHGGQISGIFNKSGEKIQGFQISGAVNIGEDVFGPQISGVGNISRKTTSGLQLAGLFNYAKNMKGVQIGVVNLADSSSGYSIGFINIVKKGKGTIALYANETMPFNIAWKSGIRKLYNIFTIGASLQNTGRAYSFGFGFGREFTLNKNLTLTTELTDQNIYLGNWKNLPVLYRLQTGLNIKLAKSLTLSAGPSFSIFHSEQKEFGNNYSSFNNKGFFHFNTGTNTQAWVGWQGGLSWNYGRSLK